MPSRALRSTHLRSQDSTRLLCLIADRQNAEARYDAAGSPVCSKGGAMKSIIIKRSIVISGHKTSITLEDAFWSGLKEIAEAQGASLSETVTEIDRARRQNNLSSAIRLFVLGHVRDQKMRARKSGSRI